MDGSLRRSLHTPPTSAGRQSDVEPKMTLLHCKLDESVRMSKLGNVLDRFLRERVGASSDGSVYEGDVEQATQTKALGVHDAGIQVAFKCCVQLHL